jgi:hypothetical protein
VKRICVTCGAQHADSEAPPAGCAICEDERQYVGARGQRWISMPALAERHANVFRDLEPGLTGIGTEPSFAISQRALLVRARGGNVLWDALSLLDEETVRRVRERGGLAAIAISHPHFQGSMVEWARAFDVPVYVHADDRRWVMRPDDAIVFWEGERKELGEGLTLVRCGGHFEGSAVLHWAAGAEGRGCLLSADTIHVVADRRFVSFMRSYPNAIPLAARTVRRIVESVRPFAFDRLYGGWWASLVVDGAKEAVERSAERYVRALEGGTKA